MGPRRPLHGPSGILKGPVLLGLASLLLSARGAVSLPESAPAGPGVASSRGLESDPKQTAFLRETNTLEPTNLLLQRYHVALCDLNLPWQAVQEKASRGNRSFQTKPGLSPLLPPCPPG